jgi:hypothetical protein
VRIVIPNPAPTFLAAMVVRDLLLQSALHRRLRFLRRGGVWRIEKGNKTRWNATLNTISKN